MQIGGSVETKLAVDTKDHLLKIVPKTVSETSHELDSNEANHLFDNLQFSTLESLIKTETTEPRDHIFNIAQSASPVKATNNNDEEAVSKEFLIIEARDHLLNIAPSVENDEKIKETESQPEVMLIEARDHLLESQKSNSDYKFSGNIFGLVYNQFRYIFLFLVFVEFILIIIFLPKEYWIY